MTKEKAELKQNLEYLAERKGSQQAVSYQDLFPQFMQKYTSFATIDFFVRELGVKDFTQIEQMAIDQVDEFVKKETKFASWEEMQQKAVSEYMMKLF